MIPSNWSVSAALTAAGLSAACCVIPLGLVSLGIGGAWMGGLTALAPYRWIFVTLAVGALAYAGYNEWRLYRQPDCDCETAFSSTTRRLLLAVGALAVLVLVVSPWVLGGSPEGATQQAPAGGTGAQKAAGGTGTPESLQQVVLNVEGMTCAACPKTVRTALEDVDGVYQAETSLEPPEAVVRFNPDQLSVEDLTRTTKNAGYPSHPKQPS